MAFNLWVSLFIQYLPSEFFLVRIPSIEMRNLTSPHHAMTTHCCVICATVSETCRHPAPNAERQTRKMMEP